ncbi:hypothetical protein [Rhodohalobacter sp. 614A]|uniref:hypothetical protein n=1 Tax=Rhodohalobacter sp. 614A TaxID=2908649 RepID=UPI001F467C78|nr:hypothetical protein [Rhodohalobacter sp. 614A]
MKEKDLKPFERWIFETYTVSAEGLGLYRIIASLFILFFLIPGMGFDHYQYLASLPADFYNPPPGPMMLFDGFPSFIIFQVLYGLALLSVFAMLVGYQTKWASISSGIFILVLQGLIYSIGKVNHEVLVPLGPILMAFTNWGNRFSIDSMKPPEIKTERPVESWPLVLLSIFIGFMMFTSGWPKILGGWLDPSTHAVKAHLFNQFFVHEREAYLAGYAIQINSQIFWEFLDWITIIFEIGFLISIRKSKWFRFFLVIAVLFHFSTKMLLNISFLPNFLAYAAFLNWDQIYKSNKSIFQNWAGYDEKRARNKSVTWFIIPILILFSILKWISVQKFFLVESDLMLHESIFLFFAVLVVLYICIKSLFRRKNSP